MNLPDDGAIFQYLYTIEEVHPEMAGFFQAIAETTPEAEAGHFQLKHLNFKVDVRVPYLSKIPLLGRFFRGERDITSLLSMAIGFGERWEREFPENRSELQKAARELEQWADMNETRGMRTATPLHPTKAEGREYAERVRGLANAIEPKHDPDLSGLVESETEDELKEDLYDRLGENIEERLKSVAQRLARVQGENDRDGRLQAETDPAR